MTSLKSGVAMMVLSLLVEANTLSSEQMPLSAPLQVWFKLSISFPVHSQHFLQRASTMSHINSEQRVLLDFTQLLRRLMREALSYYY